MAKKVIQKEKQKEVFSKKLVLLDSHAILHRAYHALPDFASSKGEPTGGLYGLAAMLIKIIDELEPDYIVATFDLPKPTYRHEAYKEYKAGRVKTDPDLVAQIIRSRDVFAAFSIPMYEKEGFEADDMLGTIVEKCVPEDVQVIIASGDMDTLQLVDGKRVQVYTLRKGIKDTILYDEKGVIERFGFVPKLLPDYKGLRGDPSDNIIGIKGIGEKTGSILIQNFGTIENMYTELKKDPGQFTKLKITPRVIELLKNGEEEALFSKMLATIRRDAPIDFKLPEKNWRDTVDYKNIEELFKELEFRTLGIRVKELLKMTDAFGDPLEMSGEGEKEEGEKEVIDERKLYETALALAVIDSNITDPKLEDILAFAKTTSFNEARETILAEIEKRNLKRVYVEIELPLIPLMKKMHDRGIKVDKKYLKELSEKYHVQLEKQQKKIWELAGQEFNINSPKQLGDILFDTLGIKVKNQKKTGGGQRSTRESELEKMRELHPIIPCIFEYRELQKLLSTYIDTIPNLVEEDGRLHTTYVQIGAATGRMASINPNLQNIPIKSELGRNIRKGFIAEKGFSLVEFDYSQIELRLAAFLSKDKKLIDIFKSGRDVHTEVAAQVFKVAPENVDKEMRRKAKVINFGILYGMGVNALRANLKTDRAEAQKFYDEYFATFHELASYLDRIKAETARKGYTETFFGRRRYFEGINSKLPFIRATAERMAINAPIQGTGADIVKIAMVRIDEYLTKEGLEKEVYPLLQVHDSLIYEIKNSLLEKVVKPIGDIMKNVMTPKETEGVPLATHCAVGESWGDMKDL
jgi:DNA polymerase I